MTKKLTVDIVSDRHYQFKQRCKFYDITPQEVIAYAIERFLDGDFDEDFGIPTD